jgi:hypothetical protein
VPGCSSFTHTQKEPTMSDYNVAARSNPFRVKDVDELRVELDPFEINVVIEDATQPDRVVLLSSCEDGWPESATDPETGDDLELDLPMLLARHLVDGDVAVLLEAGYAWPDHITGSAVAVNADGDTTTLCLVDIFEQARPLGTSVARI